MTQPARQVVLEDRNRVIIGSVEFEEPGHTSLIVFALLLHMIVEFSGEHLIFMDVLMDVEQ